MVRRSLVFGATVAVLALGVHVAQAEEPRPPPRSALPTGPEVTMAVGYARAFQIEDADAASAEGGVGADVAFGLRRPTWSVALIANHAELGRRYFTSGAGAAFTVHLLPSAAYAPWIRAGAGWRYVKYDAVDTHGIEILDALAGVDLRVSSFVAVDPAVGLRLDVLPSTANVAVSLAGVQTTAFFGMIARFDLATPGLD